MNTAAAPSPANEGDEHGASIDADLSALQPLLNAIAQARPGPDAARVFHGRGGLHPGCEHWALDVYPPVWLLTSFRPARPHELAAIGQALHPQPWVHQTRLGAGRTETRLMAGTVPDPHVVGEEGARYLVHLLRGQNHGLFLDMAEGRRWVGRHLATRPGAQVLNLFAYTCPFSVVALQAGAARVVNVDMSAGALAIGRENHRLNGLDAARAAFMAHDIFNSWAKISRNGPYDLIVLDPPSYQKGSFVAEKDYPRLMRRLPGLLAPGGHALLCLNSPEMGAPFLMERMAAEAPGVAFVERLANPAAFADVNPQRALKVLVYAQAQASPTAEADGARADAGRP